jgi:hypothetical protein
MCNINQLYLLDKQNPKLSNLIVDIRNLLSPYFKISDTNNIINSGTYRENEYELTNHSNSSISGHLKFYEMTKSTSSNWNFNEFAITIEIKTTQNTAICLDIHWHPDQEELFHDHLHIHEFLINIKGKPNWKKPVSTLKDNYKYQKLSKKYPSSQNSLLAFGKNLNLKRTNDVETGYCIDNITGSRSINRFLDELHSHYHGLYCLY